jgi:DNA modification methylase
MRFIPVMHKRGQMIRIECTGADSLPLDAIEEFQGNLKKRSKKDIELIITSIEKYGFSFPFFIWNGTGHNYCLDGHGRIQALSELRRRGEDLPMFPVVYVEAKDETEAKNKLLRLNSQYGQMSIESVMEFSDGIDIQFEELKLSDGVMLDLGKKDEIDITEQDNEMPKEPAEELQEKWQVQLGDVWECGDHIIACGSSDDEALVSVLLADKKPCICFTDPPYGVSIGDKNKMLNEHNGGKSIETNILNDTMTPEALKELLVGVFSKAKTYCSDECSFFVCSPQGGELMMMMMMMMKESGLPIRHVAMWKKNCPTFSMGRLDYDYAHEPILFTWGKKHKKIMGGSMRSSVWEVNKPKACDLHPTMKPVELYINAYLNNSEEGDYAYEPFSGSGTALLAGEKTKRKVIAIELDPKYVSVALERWSLATGGVPERRKNKENINAST